MSDRLHYVLLDKPHQSRTLARTQCETLPSGYHVIFSEPTRTLEQNAKFHSICGDIARSGLPWAGKPRSSAQWKVLLVSGHAIATKEGAEMVPGLEGEFVNLRESTALMSVKRSASLIDYTMAFCVLNEVKLSAPIGMDAV